MNISAPTYTSDDFTGKESPRAAGYMVVVVGRDGRAIYSPNLPGLMGRCPWELCWARDDKIRLREAFVQACMFRRPQQAVLSSIRIEKSEFEFNVWLDPAGDDLVICRLVRIFTNRLSRREKEILSLVAGGASNGEIARLLGTRESTVRAHLKNIRDKLGVARPEGLLLAAIGLAASPDS